MACDEHFWIENEEGIPEGEAFPCHCPYCGDGEGWAEFESAETEEAEAEKAKAELEKLKKDKPKA